MSLYVFVFAIALAVASCDNREATPDWSRMISQPKLQPFGATTLYADGVAMRPVPAGTIARERIANVQLREGRDDHGQPVTAVPLPITRALLERGRQRFDILCATCHGIAGDGESVVAYDMQLRRPPSLHEPRIIALTPGAMYRVIVDGYGLMPSYSTMLDLDDRWAVVAYVRTLELSWHIPLDATPLAMKRDFSWGMP